MIICQSNLLTMPRDRNELLNKLRAFLTARGEATALEIAQEIGVSRPTAARIIASLGDEVTMIGAARQARYSLRRDVGNIGREWPLFRVDELGAVNPVGTLHAVQHGFRLSPVPAILKKDYGDGFFSDFPFMFADVRPQGFLGRVQSRQVAASLGVPVDPREWTSAHILAYLVTYGHDLPGNLVVGAEMAERIQNAENGFIIDDLHTVIAHHERDTRYPELADRIIRGETFGSSAGGEQPKFAGWVMDEGNLPRAVIVKFSSDVRSAAGAGERWADLLLAEFHALEVLRANGIVTPAVRIIDADFRRFLEITRYDRIGGRGRRGLISLASIEAGLLEGRINTWADAARQMEAQRLLDATDAQTIRRLWCFGTLIGNSDMHFGNLSLWWRDEAPLTLAPIYDMLPMVFAPSSQGDIVERPFPIPNRESAPAEDWAVATRWALAFWNAVVGDSRFSEAFRGLAANVRERLAVSAEPVGEGRGEMGNGSGAFTAFAQRFPHVAQALTDQKERTPLRRQPDPEGRAELKRELQRITGAGLDLAPIIRDLLDGRLEPAEFADFGLRSYFYLGTGEAPRSFIAQMWADVIAQWDEAKRTDFLKVIIGQKRDIFEALDFVAEAFRRVPFTAEVMRPWLTHARERLGNDLYQRGFWRSVENFVTRSPEEAVRVVAQWLDANPGNLELGILSRVLAWLRASASTGDAIEAAVAALDQRVRSKGRAEWRALYLDSFALLSSAPALTEKRALELRDEIAGEGPAEFTAWCHVLCSIALADRFSWPWVHREMLAAARTAIPEGKYWLVVASTSVWEQATDTSEVTRDDWEQVLIATLPFTSEHKGLWNRLESFLRDVSERAPARITPLVDAIVAKAGPAWLSVMRETESESFLANLQTRDLHESLATHLLLKADTTARQIGLFIFARTHVPRLAPEALAAASPAKQEIIFREAQGTLVDATALGRLHISLAAVVPSWESEQRADFQAEIAQQALSTAAYRDTIAGAVAVWVGFKEVLTEVEELWKKLGAAAQSSALQMRVPGYERAERTFRQRFAREVSRQADKHSIFAHVVKHVHLMYGQRWRVMREGGLSEASPLQTTSHNFEVPRMEFLDPEGLNWNRLRARHRLSELEGGEA